MTKQQNLPISDADNYAEMSKPFPDGEAANAALAAFFDDVYALRNKHRIANVLLVAQGSITGSGLFMSRAHFGSPPEMESMAAWLLGQASAERQDLIRRAIEAGSAAGINPPRSRK